jgi:hypothetical protein
MQVFGEGFIGPLSCYPPLIEFEIGYDYDEKLSCAVFASIQLSCRACYLMVPVMVVCLAEASFSLTSIAFSIDVSEIRVEEVHTTQERRRWGIADKP